MSKVAPILMAIAKLYSILSVLKPTPCQAHNLLLRTDTNQLHSTELTMLGDHCIHRSEGGRIYLKIFFTISFNYFRFGQANGANGGWMNTTVGMSA
ncbi:hypothetical protein BG74_01020 [Sodalis-like endosymbiont of Proechinophthirus fluctus]|nr:hypothetical protein BG74_01020 [Sodalis-like endosymbiont of Proechinophthirus fluctus]